MEHQTPTSQGQDPNLYQTASDDQQGHAPSPQQNQINLGQDPTLYQTVYGYQGHTLGRYQTPVNLGQNPNLYQPTSDGYQRYACGQYQTPGTRVLDPEFYKPTSARHQGSPSAHSQASPTQEQNSNVVQPASAGCQGQSSTQQQTSSVPAEEPASRKSQSGRPRINCNLCNKRFYKRVTESGTCPKCVKKRYLEERRDSGMGLIPTGPTIPSNARLVSNHGQASNLAPTASNTGQAPNPAHIDSYINAHTSQQMRAGVAGHSSQSLQASGAGDSVPTQQAYSQQPNAASSASTQASQVKPSSGSRFAKAHYDLHSYTQQLMNMERVKEYSIVFNSEQAIEDYLSTIKGFEATPVPHDDIDKVDAEHAHLLCENILRGILADPATMLSGDHRKMFDQCKAIINKPGLEHFATARCAKIYFRCWHLHKNGLTPLTDTDTSTIFSKRLSFIERGARYNKAIALAILVGDDGLLDSILRCPTKWYDSETLGKVKHRVRYNVLSPDEVAARCEPRYRAVIADETEKSRPKHRRGLEDDGTSNERSHKRRSLESQVHMSNERPRSQAQAYNETSYFTNECMHPGHQAGTNMPPPSMPGYTKDTNLMQGALIPQNVHEPQNAPGTHASHEVYQQGRLKSQYAPVNVGAVASSSNVQMAQQSIQTPDHYLEDGAGAPCDTQHADPQGGSHIHQQETQSDMASNIMQYDETASATITGDQRPLQPGTNANGPFQQQQRVEPGSSAEEASFLEEWNRYYQQHPEELEQVMASFQDDQALMPAFETVGPKQDGGQSEPVATGNLQQQQVKPTPTIDPALEDTPVHPAGLAIYGQEQAHASHNYGGNDHVAQQGYNPQSDSRPIKQGEIAPERQKLAGMPESNNTGVSGRPSAMTPEHAPQHSVAQNGGNVQQYERQGQQYVEPQQYRKHAQQRASDHQHGQYAHLQQRMQQGEQYTSALQYRRPAQQHVQIQQHGQQGHANASQHEQQDRANAQQYAGPSPANAQLHEQQGSPQAQAHSQQAQQYGNVQQLTQPDHQFANAPNREHQARANTQAYSQQDPAIPPQQGQQGQQYHNKQQLGQTDKKSPNSQRHGQQGQQSPADTQQQVQQYRVSSQPQAQREVTQSPQHEQTDRQDTISQDGQQGQQQGNTSQLGPQSPPQGGYNADAAAAADYFTLPKILNIDQSEGYPDWFDSGGETPVPEDLAQQLRGFLNDKYSGQTQDEASASGHLASNKQNKSGNTKEGTQKSETMQGGGFASPGQNEGRDYDEGCHITSPNIQNESIYNDEGTRQIKTTQGHYFTSLSHQDKNMPQDGDGNEEL
ncbi:hypothetical protein K470DRAFT_83372 [Piedraia hortae CBS 480.64]|uniref:Uncharacterized protein n=1 Tax=Piedraia hortae CBS 480.64 TaxID=1314780 RepID=A0A6A7C9S1_9PEZI|nr:hypothetical protein K470DRAFT_83372 [Piedraia hortae CBS 480.64]